MWLKLVAARNSSHVLRLVHAQAGEVRRAAGLEPTGAQRVRLAVRAIFMEHGSVPRVFQLHRFGLAAFHRDRIGDDAHRFPRAAIAVLVRIGGVGVVDVEIFGVLAEDRQAPRAVLVVANRDAGQDRLAAADHVPPGRNEVHPIAQRRRGDHAMRIVGHDRERAERARAGHHPVVRSDVARLGVEIEWTCGVWRNRERWLVPSLLQRRAAATAEAVALHSAATSSGLNCTLSRNAEYIASTSSGKVCGSIAGSSSKRGLPPWKFIRSRT